MKVAGEASAISGLAYAAKVARLVDDLLDASRITRGEITLRRERIEQVLINLLKNGAGKTC